MSATRCGGVLALASAFLATCTAAADSSRPHVDLGAEQAQVHARLGPPLRERYAQQCPDHLTETRRRGQLWLKLVYDDGRLAAIGITQLALPPHGTRSVNLRWAGVAPGMAGLRAYPALATSHPVAFSTGAKQLHWFERLSTASDGRDRYVGGLVLSDASGFAFGGEFPYDVAQAVIASGLDGNDIAMAEFARPLVTWRARTPPNAMIEAVVRKRSDGRCGLFGLALLDYTDILSDR